MTNWLYQLQKEGNFPIAGKVCPGGWADPAGTIQLIAQGIILEGVNSFGMILNYLPLNFVESLSKSDSMDHIFSISAASYSAFSKDYCTVSSTKE